MGGGGGGGGGGGTSDYTSTISYLNAPFTNNKEETTETEADQYTLTQNATPHLKPARIRRKGIEMESIHGEQVTDVSDTNAQPYTAVDGEKNTGNYSRQRKQHEMIIPYIVVQELDGLKVSSRSDHHGHLPINAGNSTPTKSVKQIVSLFEPSETSNADVSYSARRATQFLLHALKENSCIAQQDRLKNATVLRVQRITEKTSSYQINAKNDDKILDCCLYMKQHCPRVCLFTLDKNLGIKALANHIELLSSAAEFRALFAETPTPSVMSDRLTLEAPKIPVMIKRKHSDMDIDTPITSKRPMQTSPLMASPCIAPSIGDGKPEEDTCLSQHHIPHPPPSSPVLQNHLTTALRTTPASPSRGSTIDYGSFALESNLIDAMSPALHFHMEIALSPALYLQLIKANNKPPWRYGNQIMDLLLAHWIAVFGKGESMKQIVMRTKYR